MKLLDCDNLEFYSGTVFRSKGGRFPFCEGYVDFMLCDYPHCGDKHSPFALYCVSGYCAGNLEYIFPLDARSDDSMSIKKEWLIENWNRKMYLEDECDVNDVEIII